MGEKECVSFFLLLDTWCVTLRSGTLHDGVYVCDRITPSSESRANRTNWKVRSRSPPAPAAPSSPLTRSLSLVGFSFSIRQKFPIPSYSSSFPCPSSLYSDQLLNNSPWQEAPLLHRTLQRKRRAACTSLPACPNTILISFYNSKQSHQHYLLTPLLALTALQKPVNCMKGAIYCLT